MLNRMVERDFERRHMMRPEYKVCGGTFLYVILLAISAKARRRGLNNEGIKESTCFMDMIKLGMKQDIIGDERTITQETSKYKYCKIEPSSWMPFTSEGYINSLNDRIENDYQSLLQDTVLWADKYLDLVQHGDWLATALLELFYYDETIDNDDTLLYAAEDGSRISLSEIYNLREIRIQPLIIGIWHYVVNQQVSNSAGLGTIEQIADNGVETGAVRARRAGMGRTGTLRFKVLIKDSPKRKIPDDATLPEVLSEAAAVLSDTIGAETAQSSGEVVPRTLAGETIALSNYAFTPYLRSLESAYRTVKTLLFRQEPRDFDTIYLANDVEAPKSYQYSIFGGINEVGSDKTILKNANVESITARTNYIILSGTGGLGKSMMMRHLLLDAIDNYERYKLLPIFVPLKDYTTDYKTLFDFIYEIFVSFEGNRGFVYPGPYGRQRDRNPLYELREIMESGRCMFLLDGLDEIKAAYRPTFERQLEMLMNGYRNNIFILSSRPYTNYVKFGRFSKMNLRPFTKDQSVALLNKLDMGQEEPLKQRFTKELDEYLFDEHKEFAENPLLLTIMLLTYKSHANIPVKMHSFYSRAYDTLFTEHDANKLGYRREYKTDLTQDKFAEYFDEFCFLSYQESNFDPSPEECKAFFSDLEAVAEYQPKFTWKDFMDDLTDSVCLMYEEGQKYHFLHRSFQEYFCARYFYRQEESSLWDIAMFFDDMDVKETDKTFAMLYDMKPKPIENNVFLRFLKGIFNPDDIDDEEAENSYKEHYKDFLLRIYPVLIWDEGDVIESSVIKPASYIYSFIAKTNGLKEDMGFFEMPYGSKDIDTVVEYVYFDPDFEENVVDDEGNIEIRPGDCEELYSADEVSSEYLEHFDFPDVVGATYQLKLHDVFEHESENDEIIGMLNEDDFPLKKEFESMHEYYQKLKNTTTIRKQDLRSKLRKRRQS